MWVVTNSGLYWFANSLAMQSTTAGSLFTCMTTWAVCLELAVYLSTDALLNPIRRFVSRYGETTHFFSDNSTNLVGAERVLREGIKA